MYIWHFYVANILNKPYWTIGARFPDCDFFKKNECQSNMPQPSCMCTVLLKLAKVERLKIRNFWVHVLFILKRWQAAIDCIL